MRNALIFALCVAIWGSTWYAIKFQLGTVPPEWAVAYRFAIAAAVLFAWCALSGRRLRFSLRDHALFAGLGALLFSVNYAFTYWSTAYLTSGLVAVVFSMMTLVNQVNGAVFLKQPIERRVLAAGVAGLVGLGLVFRPEFAAFDLGGDVAKGVAFCLLATVLASFGNTLAATERARALPLFAFNGYAMLYGALLMATIALLSGEAPRFDWQPPFVASLLYLALAGSVLAFSLYLTLIKTIGLGRSGYVAVLIPLVALGISTLFEGYRWTWSGAAGVALVLFGNLLLLGRRASGPAPIRARARRCDDV